MAWTKFHFYAFWGEATQRILLPLWRLDQHVEGNMGCWTGLPDGIFSNQKIPIFEGLAMKDVGIFCGQLVYFVAIWYILWLFGIFSQFWYDVHRKIWQPWCWKLG
jgi:hypothetical protein